MNELDRTLNKFSNRYAHSIVQVESHRRTRNGERRLWSTGVVLDGGYVATCTDGAQPTDSLYVRMSDGRGGHAFYLGQDPILGITLLKLREPHRFHPVKARESQAAVREGDSVVLLSYESSSGDMWTRVGRLDRIFSGMEPEQSAQFRVVVGDTRGACGSPILDGNGYFLGLVVGSPVDLSDAPLSPPRPDWVTGQQLEALSRGTLLAAVARLSRPRDPVGFLGVDATLRPVTIAGNESFESLSDTTSRPVEVLRVLAGSPAEIAGVQVKDIILKLNERIVSNVEELHQWIRLTPPGTTVSLTVLRNGVPAQLETRVGDRSWLEWMDRRLRRNAVQQTGIRQDIRELRLHLTRLAEEQQRYQ